MSHVQNQKNGQAYIKNLETKKKNYNKRIRGTKAKEDKK